MLNKNRTKIFFLVLLRPRSRTDAVALWIVLLSLRKVVALCLKGQ
jgi:hypothetical protein